MTNHDISVVLHEIATYLTLEGENPFKIKAFENASKVIAELQEDIAKLVREGGLQEIKGVGKSIQNIILELFSTGKITYHQELKSKYPQSIFTLLQVPNLGVKKIKILYNDLGISDLQDLEYACNENRLLELKGFGDKTQKKILKDLKIMQKNKDFYLLSTTSMLAESVLDFLKDFKWLKKIELTGALRRRKPIVSKIELLLTTDKPEDLNDYLDTFPYKESINKLKSDLYDIQSTFGPKIQIKVLSDQYFYFSQFFYTSSEKHWKKIQDHAQSLGFTLSEKGFFIDNKEINFDSEEQVFNKLKLNVIPPELREGQEEVETAQNKSLPDLVDLKSVKGVFHNHSTWSDGSASIEEMALTALDMGLEYIGISDHSRSAIYANGLSEDRLLSQMDEIKELNSQNSAITILKGIEVDILSDGSLDFPDSILSQCDFVIASVHSQLKMDPDKMIERMIRALENPYVSMIGHPTGRMLLGREGSTFDMDIFLATTKKNNKLVELNSNPHRLDLKAETLRKAKKLGIKVSINPDAHRPEGLYDIRYGVDIARRAWLTNEDCINTLNLEEVKKLLKP